MKIPTRLLRRVLLDVRLQPDQPVERDYLEISNRYQREGWGFLSITLPRLDDALLKGLSSGRVSRSDFEGFKPWKRGGSLPALLQGFFRRIFDDNGWLLPDPCIDSIYAIRQVTRLFKKVVRPCSEKRISESYERYRNNDQEVFEICPSSCNSDFDRVCSLLWSRLESFSEHLFGAPGSFGPGATAERLKRNSRFDVSVWPERALSSFPVQSLILPRDDFDLSIDFISEENETPVRVVQVPKTLKAPRTISVEPSYMMLMQQSIAKPLMMFLEEVTPYQCIHFVDQFINKDRARIGSIDGSLATIDLKDASDMISNDLVKRVFQSCPTFLDLIQDCRSQRAQMPDGSVLELRKFASMGSALCFPIEAMVFASIVAYSIISQSGRQPSHESLLHATSQFTVYGDDIIVPSETGSGVVACLEASGLKVNYDKSFLSGLFRESCGGDYYAGVDVTPVYCRRWDDTGTLRSPDNILSYVSLANQFYLKGLWHSAEYLRTFVSSKVKGIPYATNDIGILHWRSFFRNTNLVYDKNLHSYKCKGISFKPKYDTNDSPKTMQGIMLRAFGPGFHRDYVRRLRDNLCSGRPGRRVSYDYMTLPQPFPSRLSHLEHLVCAQAEDTNRSVRSYALRSKRNWTASPAGLVF